MSSRLFHSVVGVGITLGTLNGGCLGLSTSDDAHPAPGHRDPEIGKPHEERSTGAPNPSELEPEADGRPSDGLEASATAGGSQGAGGSGSGASTTKAGADAGSEPAVPADGGAGGTGGAPGELENATTSAEPEDPKFDPFCDAAWPTTKGNPGPPSCVDPNQECVNAGYPSHCYPLLEDGSCDSLNTQSPFCIDAQWECAPGTAHSKDCRCWGPLPAERTCTEDGAEQGDG